jgi:hypothetical protein
MHCLAYCISVQGLGGGCGAHFPVLGEMLGFGGSEVRLADVQTPIMRGIVELCGRMGLESGGGITSGVAGVSSAGLGISGITVSASPGNSLARASCCSLNKSIFRSTALTARRLLDRGTLRSRGRSLSSSGRARSMAANNDCSQRTKVPILWQERRNWSASARTRIT